MSLELQPSSLDEIQTDTRSSMTGIEMMTRKSAHTLGILESPLVNQPTNPGMWKLSKLRNHFRNKNLEKLYRKYLQRLNQDNLRTYILLQLITSIGFIIAALIINMDTEKDVLPEIIGQVVLFLLTLLYSMIFFKETNVKDRQHIHLVLSLFVAVSLLAVDLALAFWFSKQDSDEKPITRENAVHVPSALFSILVVYNLLPLTHLWQATVIGLSIGIVHIIKSFFISEDNAMIIADGVYYLTANFIGIYTKCLNEITLRRAFFGRRDCIESTIYLEFEKSQEEQLMLSILPSHIAAEVREDIRGELQCLIDHTSKKPFSKLYLKKHDDVSILYADIVNFTPLTMTLSVGDLVDMLNDLFGKFDEAAKENDCLRIKILGDCYNCVSGFPVSTKEHAKNCVEMGIKMIDIIADVRQGLGVDVDMRIGVHSGNVICGLLGIRKWQFDIWSRDVIIANHLEQSGKPGKVHVSLATRQLLGEEYMFEPGHGLVHDEYLADLGIDTFFIIVPKAMGLESHPLDHVHPRATVVRKPSALKNCKIDNRNLTEEEEDDSDPDSLYVKLPDPDWTDSIPAEIEQTDNTEKTSTFSHVYKKVYRMSQSVSTDNSRHDDASQKSIRRRLTKNNSTCASMIEKNKSIRSSKDQGHRRGAVLMDTALESFKSMMDKADQKMESAIDKLPLNEYRNTNTQSRSQRLLNYFLVFRDWNWERTFTTQVDPLFKLYMMGVLTTLFATAIILLILFHEFLLWFWAVWGVSIGVALITIIYLWASSIRRLFRCYRNKLLERHCWSLLETSRDSFTMRTFIFFVTTIAIVLCVLIDLTSIGTELRLKHIALFDVLKRDPSALDQIDEVYVQTDPLSLIWYFTYCCALSMTVAFGFYHVHFLLKLSIYLAAFISYAVVIAPLLAYICEAVDDGNGCNCKRNLANTSYLTHLLYLFSIVMVLHATDRQIEFVRRMDYTWQCQLRDEQGEADTTRKVNKLLLLNILPLHVADIYLDTRRSHEQLYQKEYQSVAVMFASIPNFMDFYTESEAQDAGIDGLEVLNEIISGFDELLFDERFTGIEKIKIVGSTYMAACGLSSIVNLQSIDSIASDDWSFVKTMAHFAAAMRNVLQSLNRVKSKNFQLRIGIHEGPVIAGVVGAQKPLYDIWGNTVNVASRLDYSGELDRIQVTENIAVQLKEDGVECSLRGETYLKGVGDVTTYWVNAESLLGDCSSSSSSDGPDNQFYELGNGVMGLPRKKSLLFPVSELQEVIAEEEELPDEDSIQNDGGLTIVESFRRHVETEHVISMEDITEKVMAAQDVPSTSDTSCTIDIDIVYESSQL